MNLPQEKIHTNAERMATEIEEDQRRVRFEHVARRFFNKWQPDDGEAAAEFSAELFSLVRQIHIDSMEPVRELIVGIMKTTPRH